MFCNAAFRIARLVIARGSRVVAFREAHADDVIISIKSWPRLQAIPENMVKESDR